jgi:hypothetical protein
MLLHDLDPKPVIIESAPRELRLDLACGQTPREGFEGVDLYAPNAQHKWDVLSFPWPLADNSVDEVHCSHFIEHIPMVYLRDGKVDLMGGIGGVDLLVAFFNECYRVMKRNAWMTVITPSLQSVRAFQDPTHRRFIPGEFFYYLNEEFRKVNGLDHYMGATCHFGFTVTPTLAQGIGLEARCAEVQGEKVRHNWNTTMDIHARLQAIKPEVA